jgi:hypothetical protein
MPIASRTEPPIPCRGLLALAAVALALASSAGAQEPPAGEATASADREVLEAPAPEPALPPPVAPDGWELGPVILNGDLSQRYRLRATSRETDQDLSGYLNLDGRYPGATVEGRRAYPTLAFNLQASYDLDIDSFESAEGAAAGGTYLPFVDITNTFGDRFRGFVHSAYVELQDLSFLESVRAGRQYIQREAGILFDGGHARTKRWNTLAFDVYGGVPAHLYESSAAGDALGGVGLDSRPLPGLSLGADYFYVRDQSDDRPDAEEHVYLVRGSYLAGDEWRFGGSASWVDTRDRLQQLEAVYTSREWGLLANLRARRQNGVVDFQTSEISPYVFVEGSYAPFYQCTIDLHQPFWERYGVGAGFDLRVLEDSSDSGLYNHAFRNAYLSGDVAELWPASKITVRGDVWDSDGDDIYSAGLEVEQKVLKFLRIRAGTSYALYRIDLFTGKEKERDRVYYARLRWYLRRGLELDTDYQYERDSITEYHTFIAGFRIWF